MGRPARTTPRFELFRRLARRIGVPERYAEDVAQDALLRAWEARERIEPGEDPAPYSVTIALNQARKHTRNARRRGEVLTAFDDRELQDERPSPEDLIRRRQREALIRDLISEVDPGYREVLIRHELEEQPLAEIAAELGLQLETVKTQHRRARQQLKAAKRRWRARQRSHGWDEEACIPAVALGLYPREGWADSPRKLGAKLLGQGAFIVLTGAVVAALPPSSGAEAWFRPATVHAPAAAPVALGTAPPGQQREVPSAVAMTAPRGQGLAPPVKPREAPPAAAVNGKPGSHAAAAAAGASPPVGAARPTASEREKNLIHQARKAIEAHNARADVEARRLLEMHAMEFPRGQLAGEREALLLQVR
ncbi:sigma-70 family RNA polymerase sigma factor [Sorangium sp. So ce136]|uniref:RNA polymerase sigma factor n=1 Tax=Sorangium sp. So ce136 TaxID=3133284 RepID=UPI003F0754D4